jgi:hypothetical protein
MSKLKYLKAYNRAKLIKFRLFKNLRRIKNHKNFMFYFHKYLKKNLVNDRISSFMWFQSYFLFISLSSASLFAINETLNVYLTYVILLSLFDFLSELESLTLYPFNSRSLL